MCLKYGPVVQFVDVVKNGDKIEKVRVKVLPNYEQKLKGYIHWVSKEHSSDAIVRLYNYLFNVEEVAKDDWEKDINPDSLIEKTNAKVWSELNNTKEYDRFQFERVGYFVVDADSQQPEYDNKLVFNRIVELKESKEKKVNLGK